MGGHGSLRNDAESIWKAAVEAVDSEHLVRNVVENSETALRICGQDIPLGDAQRIAVVGAGQAGAGLAAEFEQALAEDILRERVSGWVNVPADCVRPLKTIHLHAARPAGVNEPTQEGVEGARRILQIVSGLGPRDLCVVLLSGGGSALLPAPVPEITLDDTQAVTRFLMHAGADIGELNCVRKQLSQVKGGGLGRASNAGRTLVLIISDVVGDPLDVIASGPTVSDSSTPAEALAVLEKHDPSRRDVPQAVWKFLSQRSRSEPTPQPVPEAVRNHIIGNNALALQAAAERAATLGYRVHSLGSENVGQAPTVGRELADLARNVRDAGQPVVPPACILSGGEPVVNLVETDRPRKGGRNQELVLAGLERLWDDGLRRIVLLSGGTDGEDGPTDAAGARADAAVLREAKSLGLVPAEFLAINNSYPFFERAGGLLKTGPTHTNVMDVRVVLVGP